MKLSGGTIEWPTAATSRGAKRRAGERSGGVPLHRDGVRGCHPGKFLKFETQFGAIWCIFGKKLTFLQLSTFVRVDGPSPGGSNFVSGGEFSTPTEWLDKPLCLSVCPSRASLPFSRNRKALENSNLVQT